MVAEDRAPRCVHNRWTGASRAAVLVRAGSAQHREPLVIDGYERSRRHARIAGCTAFTTTTSTAKQHGTGSKLSASIMRTAAPGLANRAPSCPEQRFTAVTNGQQRSLAEVPDLRHRLSLGGRTVLPKLAVAHCPRSALGPHGIRKRWSRAGTS